jgi:hypothetical protein
MIALRVAELRVLGAMTAVAWGVASGADRAVFLQRLLGAIVLFLVAMWAYGHYVLAPV